MEELHEEVRKLLRSAEFSLVDVGTVQGQLARITLIKQSGKFPPMRVIPASFLLNMRRIPSYAEASDIAVDAADCFRKPGVSIFFFSHRWLRDTEPDDDKHTKANALAEFVLFYRTCKEFQSDPNGIYFWIDYSCIDPASPDAGKISVPLYIASCKLFVSYVTEDYYSRAWCAIERGIAKAYTKYGGTPWVIRAGFKSIPEGNADFKKLPPMMLPQEPATLGAVSVDSDRAILSLMELSASEDPKTPVLWGTSSITEIEALCVPAPIPEKKPARILAISPAGVGLTTLIRQAADTLGSGFTEDGKDRRSKTYDHHLVLGDRHVLLTELPVAASQLKTLQKMLLMIGGGDRNAASGGGAIDLVVFVISLDESDQFTDTGENRLVSSTQMFGTVQRSVGAGTPSLVVFNMLDRFNDKHDVKGILEATTADYNSSIEPMDYFKNLFVQRNFGKGPLKFAECTAVDKESALNVFNLAATMFKS